MVGETTFGDLVRRYRREAELTQEALAERAGLSVRLISSIEAGRPHRPRRDTVQLLLDALTIPVEEQAAFVGAAAGRAPVTASVPPRPLQSATLPAERVLTILIADLRGYTAYTVEHGDEAAAALARRFAATAQWVAEQFGGTVLELRGDEAMCLFGSTRQALRAALALQERCQEERAGGALPLGVGIGLDAGEVAPMDGGYRGRALNLAARLCSLAPAGTILVSDTVPHLAGTVQGIDWVDRGPIVLKGLPEPVRVLQIGRTGELTGAPPQLRATRPAPPTNLPDEPTPFIGRTAEVAAAVDLCLRPDVRLVVLTGTGGTGKTRLAMRIGARLLDRFPDGVFFVSLAALSDPALVPPAIAATLKVQEERGTDILTTLVEFLREKQLLLILDNYEQLLPAAPVVSPLLDACRTLRILVTSRTPLHLAREHEYPVSPLAIPDPEEVSIPEHLAHFDAVALFLDRARAIRPDFALTEENARAVSELCIRLDGLPLAILLAASRLRLFSPQALVQRLANRLDMLTGGPLDAPERQRTLRATLDWSYSLLGAPEKRLLAHLSVFAGGCTLEAVETVCDLEADLNLEAALSSLIEQSLVRREGEDEPRLGMLETIREYAAEHLARNGEEERLRDRHVEYYLELAETADQGWRTTQQRSWLDRIEREQDNLNSAMQWTIASGDLERAVRLTVAMHAYRGMRGHWTVHEMWLDTLLRLDIPPSTAALGRLLRCAGGMATLRGDHERAAALLQRSVALLKDRGDLPGMASSLRQQAILAVYQGRTDDAIALLNETLSIARDAGDTRAIAEALDDLGGVLDYRGELTGAASLMHQSLDLYRRLDHRASAAEVLQDLAWVALQQNDYAATTALLKDSLRTDQTNLWTTALCLEGLARAAAALGDAQRAMTLWGAVDALEERERLRFPAREAELRRAYAQIAATHISDHAGQLARERGKVMAREEAVEFALDTELDGTVSPMDPSA